MELSFIFYLFAAFIIIPGTFFALSTQRKMVAGIIASVGMLSLFILFGIQYFAFDGSYVTPPNKMAWPPSINLCPDFLSLYIVGTKPYCVDTAGVSTKPNALAKFDPSNPITNASTPGENHLFDLFTESTLSAEDRAAAIKGECHTKGVTWEGVYDGLSLYTNNNIPKPV